jgi:hypothetical protein
MEVANVVFQQAATVIQDMQATIELDTGKLSVARDLLSDDQWKEVQSAEANTTTETPE